VRVEFGQLFFYDCSAISSCTLADTLENPSPQSHEAFGRAVDISGTTVITSAADVDIDIDGDNILENDVGKAYLYDCSNNSCNLVDTISNPTPAENDRFGTSLSISNNKVVIGAFRDDVDGFVDAGAAYLYDCSGNSCNLVDTIPNPSPAAQEYFGSVDISGNNLIIGGNNVEVSGIRGAGEAYYYDCSDNNCTLIDTIPNPTPKSSSFNEERFGLRVAISGTNVVINAFGVDIDYDNSGGINNNEEDQGEVYFYDCSSGTSCVLVDTLQNPTPVLQGSISNPEKFGDTALDIQGTALLVGDRHAAVDIDGSGKIEDDEEAIGEVYLYDCSGSSCSLVETLKNPSPIRGYSFGVSASLSSENRIVVGAHGANTAYFFTDVEPSIEEPEPEPEPTPETEPEPEDEQETEPFPEFTPEQERKIKESEKEAKVGIDDPTPVSEPFPTSGFNVGTDKTSYKSGEMIEITGEGAVRSQKIIINIFSNYGKEVVELTTQSTSAGVFSTIWFIPNNLDPGTYTIKVNDSFNTATTSFRLVSDSPIPTPTPTPTPSPSSVRVSIPAQSSVPGCEETNECWFPTTVRVSQFGEVTWFNQDTEAHTVTSGTIQEGPDGNFDSSLFMAGNTFSVSFDSEGTFPYFCMVHPWMKGTVIVGEGGPIPPPPTPSPRISITVSADRAVYDLADFVNLQVILSGTTSTQNIGVSVTDPTGTVVVSRTLSTDRNGNADFGFGIHEDFKTGTYRVAVTSSIGGVTYKDTTHFKIQSQFNQIRIVSVEGTDQQGNPSSFSRSEMGFVKVVVNANKPIASLITVNLFDSELTTIGIASFRTTLSTGESEMILSFLIPDDAATGAADIFANAFSDWPSNGGVPLTGEFSAKVMIT